MEWNLEYGPKLESYLKVAAQGFKPSALEKRPAVSQDAQEYWSAFVNLDGARGMGYNEPMPISYTEIVGYGQIYGYRGERLVALASMMRTLDTIYMKKMRKAKDGTAS